MNPELYELRQTVKELLLNLTQRIDGICDKFQNEDIHIASERLVFLIDDIEILLKGVQHLQENDLIDVNIEELNEKLTAVTSELENQDFIFVSDLLLFEVKPLLEYWNGCITND